MLEISLVNNRLQIGGYLPFSVTNSNRFFQPSKSNEEDHMYMYNVYVYEEDILTSRQLQKSSYGVR